MNTIYNRLTEQTWVSKIEIKFHKITRIMGRIIPLSCLHKHENPLQNLKIFIIFMVMLKTFTTKYKNYSAVETTLQFSLMVFFKFSCRKFQKNKLQLFNSALIVTYFFLQCRMKGSCFEKFLFNITQ